MIRSPVRRASRVCVVLFASLVQACAVATVTTDGGGGGQDVIARDGADVTTPMDAPRDVRPGDGPSTDVALDAHGDSGGTTCNSNADCHAAAAPVCDTANHRCVECLPSMDMCGTGRVCDPTTNTCAAGCHSDVDCRAAVSDGGVRDASADARTDSGRTDGGRTDGGSADGGTTVGATHCLTTENRCVECLADGDCPLGDKCMNNACVPGCTASHGCPGTEACCNGLCHDVSSDPMACGSCTTQCSGTTSSCCGSTCISTLSDTMNCGGCGVMCAPPHAVGRCLSGICGIGMCDPGYANADLMASNGCECNIGTAGGTCTMATAVGPVGVGMSATTTGALTATAPNNWYAVTVAAGGAPHIVLSNTGGGAYVMDVLSACGASSTNALSCADQTAGAVGVAEYYFGDTTDAVHASRDVPAPPTTIYVRVYSAQQPSGCVGYSLLLSN